MGMDVYGKEPVNKTGEYFRNNAWWWRPLADYCIDVAPEITGACAHWRSNDGDGLDAAGARALAAKLREKIAEGQTEEFAVKRQAELDAMPDKPCQWCGGSGVRVDDVGRANKMPEKIIGPETGAEPDHPRFGQKGWCNGCKGVGHDRPSACRYPFNTENVAGFCDFLEQCGGFEIS